MDPACAVGGIAGGRIVDCRQSGEVTDAHLRGRNAQHSVAALRRCGAFPRSEEEQFVLFDGTAKCSSELIVDTLRRIWAGRCVGIEEQILGAPLMIGSVLERDAVKAVGARLW